MTYQYNCDGFCNPETIYGGRPALTAEFSEEFIKASQAGGDVVEHGYEEGNLVTLCPECTRKLLTERP
ncbi:hypothetical protein [Halosolutus halophilus]|uniref:hypothetical protein n=1 Tax=Halosolutus halophilus TaxID=1552990 RepID=UPI00223528CF|nr:hypothetical protein [Halosolutus halophilus]